MSVRRPMPKPRIPKLKKPSISKRKRLTSKSPTLTKKKATVIKTTKPTVHKKSTRRTVLGTCYLQKNCKGVLSRQISKSVCKTKGGKSWKKTGGTCENL